MGLWFSYRLAEILISIGLVAPETPSDRVTLLVSCRFGLGGNVMAQSVCSNYPSWLS